MDTTMLQVGLFRTHEGRAAEPHYAPTDGIPVTDIDEVKEAIIQITRFAGHVEEIDVDSGTWLVELPQAYEDSLRAFGYWTEGTEEYTMVAEWPE
jgi:hypothetical protein